MRIQIFAFTLLAAAAIAPQAFAQDAASAAPKIHTSAADIQAMIDAGKAGNLISIGAYKANLELRAPTVGNSALHPLTNEFFYIIDGSIDMTYGGTLDDQKPNDKNPNVVLGSKIEGGTTVRLNKGDFFVVPAGTPHQLTPVGGKAADMSLMLPK